MTPNPPRLALVIGWPWTQEKLRLAKQLGVSDIVGGPPTRRGQPKADVWEFLPLLHQKRTVADTGFRLEVIESNPPMDKIILALPGRDEQIQNFCKTLRNMGAAGIHILAYAWAVLGWMRTSLAKPTRGDARVTAFDYDLMRNAPLTEHGVVTEDHLWDSWTYFIKKVIPVAEEAKVKLALHPDDPPISPVRGIARPFRSVDAFKRVRRWTD